MQFQGWSGVQNGELIKLIDGQFDVSLTGDKNLRYQQNILGRKISIIELPYTRLGALEPYVDRIKSAIISSAAGSYAVIEPSVILQG